jgi:translation initiation factor 3 subunit I
MAITGSADNTAKLWNVQTGKCLKTWEFMTAVKRVEFNEDDDMALCVTEERMGYPGTVTVISIKPDLEATRKQATFVRLVFGVCHQ